MKTCNCALPAIRGPEVCLTCTTGGTNSTGVYVWPNGTIQQPWNNQRPIKKTTVSEYSPDGKLIKTIVTEEEVMYPQYPFYNNCTSK